MNSRIFHAEMMHARHWPVAHRFRLALYRFAVDVDELPELARRIWLFGHNRRWPVAIHDRDYLRAGAAPLRDKAVGLLAEQGLAGPWGRIILVTTPRVLNCVFNPVSFFHCHRPDGALGAVIAHVNNTFGETHLYVLPTPDAAAAGAGRVQAEADKVFHVSPFFAVAGGYEFHFADIREKLDILIHLKREGKPVFTAHLRGRRTLPLTTRHLLATLARFPLAAFLTIPRIWRQAATLYFRKKLPVFHKPPPTHPLTVRRAPPTRLERWAQRLVTRHLDKARSGALVVELPDGAALRFGAASAAPPARMGVHDMAAFRRMLFAGEIGLGDAYVDRLWDTDDVAETLGFFIHNWAHMHDRQMRSATVGRWWNGLRHAVRVNSIRGSRRNIHEHYDLSNEFFALFLDESMTYSCGIHDASDGDDLAAAQRRKLDAILRLARIDAKCHVLDIGCGWGGFAMHAARQTGCRVTGITVSEEQYTFARRRVAETGLADRIDIRLCDYRQMTGSFDRIVSIEMLEAVGHRYLGAFFAACDRLLNPGGRVALQVITIPDQRYDEYRRGADWIRKAIFPGGHLPSLTAMCTAMTSQSSLVVEELTNIGPHYAHTLRAWSRRLAARRDELLEQGFDERFHRMWHYYFGYCEAGFANRVLNNLHLVLTRPGGR